MISKMVQYVRFLLLFVYMSCHSSLCRRVANPSLLLPSKPSLHFSKGISSIFVFLISFHIPIAKICTCHFVTIFSIAFLVFQCRCCSLLACNHLMYSMFIWFTTWPKAIQAQYHRCHYFYDSFIVLAYWRFMGCMLL